MNIFKKLFNKLTYSNPAEKFRSSGYIQTYTGKKFYFQNPTLESIDIVDIAHSLSLFCRFTSHTKELYSVGAHSIHASYICDEKYALEALLHDSTEAYMGDMSSPLKKIMKEYKKLENEVLKLICEKYNLKYPLPKTVKEADLKMFEIEWVYLMNGNSPNEKNFPIKRENLNDKFPKEIEILFLDRFYELYNERTKNNLIKNKVESYNFLP